MRDVIIQYDCNQQLIALLTRNDQVTTLLPTFVNEVAISSSTKWSLLLFIKPAQHPLCADVTCRKNLSPGQMPGLWQLFFSHKLGINLYCRVLLIKLDFNILVN